jgi:hypothetical protein
MGNDEDGFALHRMKKRAYDTFFGVSIEGRCNLNRGDRNSVSWISSVMESDPKYVLPRRRSTPKLERSKHVL